MLGTCVDGSLGEFYTGLRGRIKDSCSTSRSNLFFHLLCPVFVTSRLFGAVIQGSITIKLSWRLWSRQGYWGSYWTLIPGLCGWRFPGTACSVQYTISDATRRLEENSKGILMRVLRAGIIFILSLRFKTCELCGVLQLFHRSWAWRVFCSVCVEHEAIFLQSDWLV